MSIPAAMPAEVMILPLSTKRRFSSNRKSVAGGDCSRSLGHRNYVEGRWISLPARNGEDLEGTAEIKDFSIVEQKDCEFSGFAHRHTYVG